MRYGASQSMPTPVRRGAPPSYYKSKLSDLARFLNTASPTPEERKLVQNSIDLAKREYSISMGKVWAPPASVVSLMPPGSKIAVGVPPQAGPVTKAAVVRVVGEAPTLPTFTVPESVPSPVIQSVSPGPSPGDVSAADTGGISSTAAIVLGIASILTVGSMLIGGKKGV